MFGTTLLRIDLVPWDTPFTPSLPKRTPFKFVKTVGTLNTLTYLNRNVATQVRFFRYARECFAGCSWSAQFGDGLFYEIKMPENVFENGTRIPTGQYKILGRALRVFGDPNKEEDYESWLSPMVGFP